MLMLMVVEYLTELLFFQPKANFISSQIQYIKKYINKYKYFIQ